MLTACDNCEPRPRGICPAYGYYKGTISSQIEVVMGQGKLFTCFVSMKMYLTIISYVQQSKPNSGVVGGTGADAEKVLTNSDLEQIVDAKVTGLFSGPELLRGVSGARRYL